MPADFPWYVLLVVSSSPIKRVRWLSPNQQASRAPDGHSYPSISSCPFSIDFFISEPAEQVDQLIKPSLSEISSPYTNSHFYTSVVQNLTKWCIMCNDPLLKG
ncbi:hypothetical protein AVEN_80744-1 [Araneus ventricosus]|uniref:Uncharacterized protein n=1 Tax=Araneus ventricosus TaxID=182803 RepID=A0A4Y2MME2_ARAVE|nr:hypothetical protein AVEN_80744-1 [Araneus ventricosus]